MKLRLFQVIGAIACIGLWLVLATANIEALTSLGSKTSYVTIAGLTLTTKTALGGLAIVIDILLIASAFAACHWWARCDEVTATAAVLVWGICALTSWHSTKVWLENNIAAVSAPATQSQDVYSAIKSDLNLAQKNVERLMSLDAKRFKRSERRETNIKINEAKQEVRELRHQLAGAKVVVASHPIEGFETYVATGLVALNALAWFSIFGAGSGGQNRPNPASATAIENQANLATALQPENYRNINAVTAPRLVAKKPSKTVARTGGKPAPPEPPPGTRKPAARRAAKRDNVVAINSAAVSAVKAWIDDSTTKRNGAFVATADAWEAYQDSGMIEVRKDDFCKVLKDVVDAKYYGRRGGVRGYNGIELVPAAPNAKRATG